MSRQPTAIATITSMALAAVIIVGLMTGCDPPSHDVEPGASAEASEGESSSVSGDEQSSSKGDENPPDQQENSEDEEEEESEEELFDGESLDADDALAVVEVIAASESVDGRRLATNLVRRLTEDGRSPVVEDAGWEVVSVAGEEAQYRARFAAGDFTATFAYDGERGRVEPLDDGASEVFDGDGQVRPPSFYIYPEAYDPKASSPEERWTAEFRERLEQLGGPGMLEAMGAVLRHDELMEDATYMLVQATDVDAAAFRECQESRDCRWSVGSLASGQLEVSFDAEFDDHSVTMSWAVDLEEQVFGPRNSAAHHLHQVRLPAGELSLPFSEPVAFDDGEGDDEEDSDRLPRIGDDELNEVINEEFTDIRRCILRGLDDAEPGSVESWYIHFYIDTRGRVGADSFSVQENAEEDVTDAAVGRCLKEIFLEMEFPPLPTPRGVQYPLYVR